MLNSNNKPLAVTEYILHAVNINKCFSNTAELVTVSTMINDLVILTSIEEFKDIIIRVTVKFTVTDNPEISKMITEDFVNPWVRVPSTILQSQQDSPVSVQVFIYIITL